MEHAYSSYAHIILQMLIAHWVKFKPTQKKIMPKSYTNAYSLFPMSKTNKHTNNDLNNDVLGVNDSNFTSE
jgi:hypothetical protein